MHQSVGDNDRRLATIASRAAATALGQWPVVAAAWAVHGALLFLLFFTRVPDQVSLGQKLGIGMGLGFLLLFEVGLLSLGNFGLETAADRVRGKWRIDVVKSLVLAALVGILSASTLKFHATSVHLKYSDLWFARKNFMQILQEASLFEVAGVLVVPLGSLALGLVLFVGLQRTRRRPSELPPRGSALLVVLCGLGFGLTCLSSPAVRHFAADFIPETHRLAVDRGFASPAKAVPVEAAAALGPPIVRYAPEPRAGLRNVVLIMLESIPWSRTSLGGWRSGVIPNLESLVPESLVFSRPYTTSTHSDYAQMAILSSLHPRKYDRHDYYTQLDYPRTLLWDALEPAGYATAMFSCQNETWGNMLAFLDTPGLDVLRHSLDWPRARHRGRGSESKVYEETPVDEWIAWRRDRGPEPYFTYLNFQSNHFPYESPPDARRPFGPYELDFPVSFIRYPKERVPILLNRFDNALHYADAQIGRVVEYLRASGEWERTALVVVSDHGEAFYEHDEPTHGTSLYEEQVRSFLLMRLPGEPARTIDEPVSLLDVGPALLDYLGLPPHGNFQGRGDILDPGYSALGRPFHFTIQGLTFEDGVLLDDWKYIVNWDRRFRRLFDLGSDPAERENALEERPERAELLDRELGGFLGRQRTYYANEGWRAGRYPPALEGLATDSR